MIGYASALPSSRRKADGNNKKTTKSKPGGDPNETKVGQDQCG